ncbi:uncharacterized protein LOC115816487 [Chanos chanos]|uniref:Uncharacterized protein LOC115816487 n=1 Tax=Chanos chanos TaxID=29144 RepID=A0A6J2VVV0_CHACN|nr:uncharacterized protein LOC115816487 [Chanos chanos]
MSARAPPGVVDGYGEVGRWAGQATQALQALITDEVLMMEDMQLQWCEMHMAAANRKKVEARKMSGGSSPPPFTLAEELAVSQSTKRAFMDGIQGALESDLEDANGHLYPVSCPAAGQVVAALCSRVRHRHATRLCAEPSLYSLFTYDCVPVHGSNTIIKFADCTTVVGLIREDDKTAYRDEVEHLAAWCADNNLALNTQKTKEIIVDFRRARSKAHAPIYINGVIVERVPSFKLLAVTSIALQSLQIQPGPPARYILTTKRSSFDKDERVRRWTFGKRDNNKPNKTILVVGETGTGKTTLINTMVNYVLGVRWEDRMWFEITEEDGDRQYKSQTSAITVYEIFPENSSISLSLIDTPGYGGTGGVEKDKEISENLLKLFQCESGVHEIDAVCLVVAATQKRLSDRQRYIFDAVISIFGKDIEKNIVLMITHSRKRIHQTLLATIDAARIPYARDERKEAVYFAFDNCQTEDYDEEDESEQEASWKKGMKRMDEFIAFLNTRECRSLQMTQGVMRQRKQLEATVDHLEDQIEFIEAKHRELAQTEKALEENEDKMKKNENFTYEVEVSYKVKVPIKNASWWDSKATCCTVCKENCHKTGCWWVSNLQWCEVMEKNHCTKCEKKCHHTKHVKEDKIYVLEKKKEKRTYDELKRKYENSKEAVVMNVDIMKKIKEELTAAEQEKSTLVVEAYQYIMTLCEIALKPDSLSTLQHLDFLIPRVQEIGKSEWVEKLMDLRKTEQEEDRGAWNYMKGFYKAGKKKILG